LNPLKWLVWLFSKPDVIFNSQRLNDAECAIRRQALEMELSSRETQAYLAKVRRRMIEGLTSKELPSLYVGKLKKQRRKTAPVSPFIQKKEAQR